MKWAIVLLLIGLNEVKSGPQTNQQDLNSVSVDNIKSHLKCTSPNQQKIMDYCQSRVYPRSNSIQSVAACILQRNNAIVEKSQQIDLVKVKKMFVEKSSLSTQQKRTVTADFDACVASHSTAKSSSGTAILKTYLCTVDSMIVNGCADEKAQLIKIQAEDGWVVYRGDPKKNPKLPNQQEELVVRRTWLRKPLTGVDSQKQTQPEGVTFPSVGTTVPTVTVPTDPTIIIEPIDPGVIPSASNITISIVTLSKNIQVTLQILDGQVL